MSIEQGRGDGRRCTEQASRSAREHLLVFAAFGAVLLVIGSGDRRLVATPPAQRERPPEPLLVSPGETAGLPGGEEAALFHRADVYIAAGKLDDAETLLRERLRTNPDSAGALYRLGRVYFDRHKWAESADYLVQSLKIEPRDDRAHLILGLDYYQLNRDEGAERHLLQAVEQNPRSDENQYMAGRFFYSKHKRSEALSFFYEAIRLNPDNYKALHSVGLCLNNLGQQAMAERYYRRAIETAERKEMKFGQAYLDLAELLTGTQSSKVEEGEFDARRAIELLPDSALAYYVLGKALYRQERISEAVPQLVKSSQLDPSNSLPHFLLAKIYQKLGRHAEAQKESEIYRELAKGARRHAAEAIR